MQYITPHAGRAGTYGASYKSSYGATGVPYGYACACFLNPVFQFAFSQLPVTSCSMCRVRQEAQYAHIPLLPGYYAQEPPPAGYYRQRHPPPAGYYVKNPPPVGYSVQNPSPAGYFTPALQLALPMMYPASAEANMLMPSYDEPMRRSASSPPPPPPVRRLALYIWGFLLQHNYSIRLEKLLHSHPHHLRRHLRRRLLRRRRLRRRMTFPSTTCHSQCIDPPARLESVFAAGRGVRPMLLRRQAINAHSKASSTSCCDGSASHIFHAPNTSKSIATDIDFLFHRIFCAAAVLQWVVSLHFKQRGKDRAAVL